MKRKLLVGLAALSLVACSSGNDAADTTAPPTTATAATPTPTVSPSPSTAPATAATTTSAAPTIAPPTTPVTSAPAGARSEAVAEVTTRLNAFWAAIDTCLENPDACDANAIVDEYAEPTTPIATWLVSWDTEYASRGQRVTKSDQITRELVDVQVAPDEQSVFTIQCVTNGSVVVEDTNTGSTVTDDAVGYSNTSMLWTKVDDRWIVTGSQLNKLDQSGDSTCTFA